MRTIISRIASGTPLLILLALGNSGSARAADAGPSDDAGSTDLQIITVTARKRGESLAEVPTSITAFTAESLQDFNIQSFNDYATMTPNLSFSYGGGPAGTAASRAAGHRRITQRDL